MVIPSNSHCLVPSINDFNIGLETFEKVVVLPDFSIIQMLAVLELIVCCSSQVFPPSFSHTPFSGWSLQRMANLGYLPQHKIHFCTFPVTSVDLCYACCASWYQFIVRIFVKSHLFFQDCVFWKCSYLSGYVCSTVSVQFGLLLLGLIRRKVPFIPEVCRPLLLIRQWCLYPPHSVPEIKAVCYFAIRNRISLMVFPDPRRLCVWRLSYPLDPSHQGTGFSACRRIWPLSGEGGKSMWHCFPFFWPRQF